MSDNRRGQAKAAHKASAAVLACVLATAAGSARGAPDADIVVTAAILERTLYETPAALSVVDREAIQQGQLRNKLNESLALVPGVFLQNPENYAQGERIAIRGFGARAPFGVRGVTVLVDGIPYTLPDGQAQLDAIDLDTAERIEVIRGPASVLYGNAAGGVISVTTGTDGRPDMSRVRTTAGSHGFGKAVANTSGSDGLWSHSASLSALRSDGYRDQNEVEKYLLNAKTRRQLEDQRAVTLVLNLLDNPRSEDPGALTLEQVQEDRTQSGRFTKDYDTGQTVDQQVMGLQYEDLAAGPGEYRAKTFYLRRNFEQQLPFPGPSRIDYNRDYFGLTTDYRQSFTVADYPARTVVGAEARRQRDDRTRREVSFAGELQGETADEVQTATALSVFSQSDLDVTNALTVSAGVRFDDVRLEIDDQFPDDGNQSGDRSFQQWSGSAGLSYRYRPNHQAYANLSTAFETPTFAEFANPSGEGGFNPEVEPQKAVNHELGLRGELANGVSYDLALFLVKVRDEITPYTLPGDNDRTFYRNTGDTTRKGLEASAAWRFLPAWQIETALTLARYTFDDYQADGTDFAGNRLPGLPEQVWNTRLHWTGLGGRFGTLETRYVGDLVADNANSVEVDEYWLVNLRGGDAWPVGRSSLLKAFAGVSNVFDEDYFANVRINASNGRYYEPAAGRTYYAGLEFSF